MNLEIKIDKTKQIPVYLHGGGDLYVNLATVGLKEALDHIKQHRIKGGSRNEAEIYNH